MNQRVKFGKLLASAEARRAARRRLGVLLIAALLPATTWSAEVLRFGIPKSIVGSLSSADAKITMESILGNRLFDRFSFQAHLYEDGELFKGVRSGSIASMVLRSTDFVRLRREGVPLSGNHVPVTGDDSFTVTYVLLCKKKTQKRQLDEFAGKELNFGHGEGADVGRLWLDLVLHEAGLPRVDSHFSKTNYYHEASKALIPLFFGRADICLVRKESWYVLAELNPQLKTSFQVLAESPPVLETLTCVNEAIVPPTVRNEFRSRMADLHKSSRGRSLLTITRVKRFVPFEEEMLKSIIDLVERHDALGKEAEPLR